MTFDANTAALGGPSNTQSYVFHLDASSGAQDVLNFADAAANQSAPAVVTGFSAGDEYALGGPPFNLTHDILAFDSGSQVLINGVYVTGQAGLSDTVSNGIITFGGIALAGDSVSQLLTAAENIVNSGSGSGNTAAFLYHGDTYVVHEAATANPTNDVVVQLQGESLAGLTFAGDTALAHASYAMIG